MARYTPKTFSMQAAFEILLRRPSTKEIIAYLTSCKTSSLENAVETVFPTGGEGNVYIGVGFTHSRRATLSVETATFNTEVMAIQNGTEVIRGTEDITYYDAITVEDEDDIYITHKPKGTTGNEIGYVYLLDDSGGYEKTYTQSTKAGTGTFAYSDYKLTFGSDGPVAGDKIVCAYTYATPNSTQTIKLKAKTFPPVLLVTAYGIARDICSGELFPCVIEGRAVVSGNWNLDLQSDGDPIVQNIEIEFVKTCLNDELYKFVVFDEPQDLSDAQDTIAELKQTVSELDTSAAATNTHVTKTKSEILNTNNMITALVGDINTLTSSINDVSAKALPTVGQNDTGSYVVVKSGKWQKGTGVNLGND